MQASPATTRSRIAADIGADAFLPSPVDGKGFTGEARALLAGKDVFLNTQVGMFHKEMTSSE